MQVEGENGEPITTIVIHATVNDAPLLRKLSERFAEAAEELDSGTSASFHASFHYGWFSASSEGE
jgi:hypothetical protein